jgi:hypothetical protein
VRVNVTGGDARPFRWSPDTVRRLYEDVEWALTSNPSGAAQVAGIFLGRSDSAVEILDCHPVFLMKERDHTYALAGPGRREFERTIAAFKSNPKGELSVIGFYRSHMGDRFDLTEEDLGLIRTCFRGTSQVVLLIKLTGDGSSSVRLFLGDQGQAPRESDSFRSAPGLPRWLELWSNLANSPEDTAGPGDTTEPVQTATPADAPIRETRDFQEGPVALERRLNRSPVFLFAVAIILSLLVAYLVFKGSASLKQGAKTFGHVQSDVSHQSGLALRAERQGDDLRLDWDHTARIVAACSGGILAVREGNAPEKQFMLDGNLLRTGSMVYRPVHGDVFFRLVVLGQRGTKLGESVTTYSGWTSVIERDPYKESK